MKADEEEIKELLKRQGKLNTDIKVLKKTKTKIMDEMVASMSDADAADTQDSGKKQIETINATIESYQEEMYELPKKINEVNYRLMLATMEQCYDIIKDNTVIIKEIAEWINNKELVEDLFKRR